MMIEGYSRAAVQTYWRLPEWKIGFDLGGQPWSFMGTGTWFVSHGHLDHVAALPVYVARRRMMKMEPPVIYLPAETIESVEKILKLFTRLDRGRMPCQLLPLHPGQEVELSRELVVTVSQTRHTVPSLGFVVWERRRKLKAEYQDLAGPQIRDLRLGGTEVTEERRVPRFAYLGDSAPEGLDNCPAMFEAQVLVLEMTFVAPSHRKDKIHKFGHTHLDDIIERRARFKNELIIASHFSTRYHGKRIRDLVERAIPDMLDNRLHLWL
jgi:ribonuclease Z